MPPSGRFALRDGGASVEFVSLPLVDFPASHPEMAQMLRRLGLPAASGILRKPFGPPGLCYFNALDYAHGAGGSLALGWSIDWLPGVFIRATHHGVCRLPSGELVDVTAADGRPPEDGVSTFAPDSSLRCRLDWPSLIEDRCLVLVDDEDVVAALDAQSRNMAHLRDFYAEVRRLPGYSWNPRQGLVGPPLPPLSRDYDALLEESHVECQHFRRILAQRYAPQEACALSA